MRYDRVHQSSQQLDYLSAQSGTTNRVIKDKLRRIKAISSQGRVANSSRRRPMCNSGAFANTRLSHYHKRLVVFSPCVRLAVKIEFLEKDGELLIFDERNFCKIGVQFIFQEGEAKLFLLEELFCLLIFRF